MTELSKHRPPPEMHHHGAGYEPTKMMFRLPTDAWHGFASEGLWVQPGDDDSYVLLNSPFFVSDVSYRDVVKGDLSSGWLEFAGVLKRGGHSTYRIIPKYDTAAQPFLSLWREMEEAGCTHEEAKTLQLLAIDVPPEADIQHVYALLEGGVAAGIWDFQEGHCGHKLP